MIKKGENMKVKEEFILRDIAGMQVLIPIGTTNLRFNGIIYLKSVSVEIWKSLEQGKEKEEILEILLEQFDVSREEASKDLDAFIKQLKENDLLEE